MEGGFKKDSAVSLNGFESRVYINNISEFKKLIGVQSNHGVEYFGGPASPTH